MSDFESKPPSQQAPLTGQFFRGGLMAAAPSNNAHLIVYDLRNLKISAADGEAIEKELRKHLYNELHKRGLAQNRSEVSLGTAVFGVAID